MVHGQHRQKTSHTDGGIGWALRSTWMTTVRTAPTVWSGARVRSSHWWRGRVSSGREGKDLREPPASRWMGRGAQADPGYRGGRSNSASGPRCVGSVSCASSSAYGAARRVPDASSQGDASHRTHARNPSPSWTDTSARVLGPRAHASVIACVSRRKPSGFPTRPGARGDQGGGQRVRAGRCRQYR